MLDDLDRRDEHVFHPKDAGNDPLSLEAQVVQALDDLRPHLRRDGGDCEFVKVERNVVYLRLSGNCVGCQLASITLAGIQAKLASKLGLPLRVVPVS